MALTCLPYLLVALRTPSGAMFPWVLFNTDDHAVYFSWMRQGMDGRWLIRNLFTTDRQSGAHFHAYFQLLGAAAGLLRLDLALAYHVARLLTGAGALVLVYRLAAWFTDDVFERRCALWVTALSGGIGWLFWRDRVQTNEPVDVWQPEALTFPSLYTNGLFTVSLLLMLGVVLGLIRAERNGKLDGAVAAGLCGLVLGNVHSYDMIHLTVVWLCYLLLRGQLDYRLPWPALKQALIAAAIASPSVLAMAWLYLSEPVFRSRADTQTLTPGFDRYVLGYGLLLPLAGFAARELALRSRSTVRERRGDLLFPITWAVVGLCVAYLPFAFQRKLVMGVHLPLGLLAGIAVARLTQLARRHLSPGMSAALLIAVLSPSSVLYLARDIRLARDEGVTSTGVHPVYWNESQINLYRWIGEHTPRESAVLAFPFDAVFVPAFSGRAVYAGHWGETPRFSEKPGEIFGFYWGLGGSEGRREFLRRSRVRLVVDGPLDRQYVELFAGARNPPGPQAPLASEPFLREVHRVGDAILYEFVDESAAAPTAPASFPSAARSMVSPAARNG